MNTSSQKPKISPLSVVLPYFLLSSISLIVLSVLFFFIGDSFYSHYFQPALLSITHIAVLGFITSIIFGSIYQMHQVLFEVPIYSPLMAKISFTALVTGIIFLCVSFYKFSIGILCQTGAILTFISFIFFALNFFLATSKSKANLLETDIISSSVLWLLVTGLVGVLLVFNFTYVFIPMSHLEILTIHAHLGFAGWIILLIIGVSAKTIPMFYLQKKPNKKALKTAYLLINSGLILLSISIYWNLQVVFRITSALLLAAGIISFLYFVSRAFTERKRNHPETELTVTTISFFFLVATLPLGILLSTGILNPKTTVSISIIYGIIFIIGFCGTIIIGQTLKIIPYMLSTYKHQPLAGQIKTSLPKKLISEKAANWMMALFIGGILTLCLSFLTEFTHGIKISSLFLTSAAVIFNYAIFRAFLSNDPSTVE